MKGEGGCDLRRAVMRTRNQKHISWVHVMQPAGRCTDPLTVRFGKSTASPLRACCGQKSFRAHVCSQEPLSLLRSQSCSRCCQGVRQEAGEAGQAQDTLSTQRHHPRGLGPSGKAGLCLFASPRRLSFRPALPASSVSTRPRERAPPRGGAAQGSKAATRLQVRARE